MLERINRAMYATYGAASTSAGMMTLAAVPHPPTGSTPRSSANTSTHSGPVTNRPGVERAVLPHRREHPQPHPGGRGDEKRQRAEGQRNGHRLREDFVHRAVAVLDGEPQVAVEQVA